MTTEETGEILTVDDPGQHPVTIHVHGEHAEININVTHYHYPDWLSIETVREMIREIKT